MEKKTDRMNILRPVYIYKYSPNTKTIPIVKELTHDSHATFGFSSCKFQKNFKVFWHICGLTVHFLSVFYDIDLYVLSCKSALDKEFYLDRGQESESGRRAKLITLQ